MRPKTVLLSILVVTLLLTLPPGVRAQQNQGQGDPRMQNLVQMPVAVGKASDAGVPDRDLNRMTGALNRGQIDPATFNQTLRTTLTEVGLEGITSVGSFALQKLENGLRGEALARAIHGYLNERFGIPAGRTDVQGPPPIAERFIPEEAQNRIQRERALQRPTRVPGPAQGPGGFPGGRPVPGSGMPGPPGPSGGGFPGGGGPPGGIGR